MKKFLCVLLALMLIGSAALAAPDLSSGLLPAARQAMGCLATGEYERVVTLLPFSGVAPSASEWQSFADNFSNLSSVQRDYAVGYWTGSVWKVAVPVQEPSSGSVEVLVLTSEDGASFTGYRYAAWSAIETEISGSSRVIWDQEYVGGSARIVAD